MEIQELIKFAVIGARTYYNNMEKFHSEEPNEETERLMKEAYEKFKAIEKFYVAIANI